MKRINEQKTGTYLEIHYGEIKEEIHELSSGKNFAGIFQAIVNHIHRTIAAGQIQKTGTKIKLIGWLHKRGNDYVQYVIENLFVRSFEGMKRRCTAQQWLQLYQVIPRNLRNVYEMQNTNYLTQKTKI